MQTYKQFLIYSNLRCYLDHGGNLTPMFVHTEFQTLEEAQARIDRYWEEWQQWEERRRQFSMQNSLNELVQEDYDRSDEARENDAEDFSNRLNQYYEREIN